MHAAANIEATQGPRRFVFEHDTFAFANELHWAYAFDPATGKPRFSKRDPQPTYAHRCFVLTRAARQFLFHARFEKTQPPYADAALYRRAIRAVMARNPRIPCTVAEQIAVPGFANLREFSRAHAGLLKANCGGAWQSYVLRSHWRMVFPISREHQDRTAASLQAAIERGGSPIIHLVRFPQLTINHGMILFAAETTPERIRFAAYDPNAPQQPTEVIFDRASRTFSLPANEYWAGGPLNVIEIYRTWWM